MIFSANEPGDVGAVSGEEDAERRCFRPAEERGVAAATPYQIGIDAWYRADQRY